MILHIEKEDWNELFSVLREAEKNLFAQGKGNSSPECLKASQQALQAFHTTAAMLGLPDLERVGIQLEDYVRREIQPTANAEAIAVFGFAVNALIESMEKAGNVSKPSALDVGEVLEILGLSPPETTSGMLTDDDFPAEFLQPLADPVETGSPEKSPAEGVPEDEERVDGVDLYRLEQAVAQLGGEMSISANDGSGKTLELRFQAQPGVVEQIETLLSAGVPALLFAPQISQQGGRFDKIINTINDFMLALSNGECKRAQEVLLNLAEEQHQAGLYNEIGSLARELHNSLKDFMEPMDPGLKVMVEEKIPDTGNRLEHILKLTESSANTTIDHVEAMQKRNEKEREKLNQLYESLGKLTAIGEQAQKRVQESHGILDELKASLAHNHDDLIAVLTAQDYQDLTGQIIEKIIQLLKDLELKLINVIKTFGVKLESGKCTATEELYGPAHKGKTEALHSQDDVDALLADFGF